jgi:hypothetical protein
MREEYEKVVNYGGERAGIVEVKRRMLATEDASIADEENDEEI